MHAKDGSIAWKVPRSSKRLTYSTPCILSGPAGRDMAVFTNWEHGITGLDPASGRVLWEKDVFGKPSPERAIGSPVVAGDLVIGTCGFVTKLKHAVALRADPATGAVEEVWRIERSVPHIPTVLVVGERVYLWNDQGIVTCADRATGKVLWNERTPGEYFGSPVCAGDRIFAVNKTGTVVVLAASDTFRILAENKLEETCHTTPALAGGRMYIRTYERLHAIGKRP